MLYNATTKYQTHNIQESSYTHITLNYKNMLYNKSSLAPRTPIAMDTFIIMHTIAHTHELS